MVRRQDPEPQGHDLQAPGRHCPRHLPGDRGRQLRCAHRNHIARIHEPEPRHHQVSLACRRQENLARGRIPADHYAPPAGHSQKSSPRPRSRGPIVHRLRDTIRRGNTCSPIEHWHFKTITHPKSLRQSRSSIDKHLRNGEFDNYRCHFPEHESCRIRPKNGLFVVMISPPEVLTGTRSIPATGIDLLIDQIFILCRIWR